MSKVAAIVLAAGGSTRMGRPKQLLLWNGRSLLRHVVETAFEAGCDPVVVVLGAAADRLREDLKGTQVVTAENRDWQLGPGTSIRRGLDAVGSSDAALFLACDQPFVDAAHLRRLVDAYETSGLAMAASGYADSAGVPALFSRECFAELRGLPSWSGAKQLLVRRPEAAAVVPFPAGSIDLDSPEDYERFLMEQRHGHRF